MSPLLHLADAYSAGTAACLLFLGKSDFRSKLPSSDFLPELATSTISSSDAPRIYPLNCLIDMAILLPALASTSVLPSLAAVDAAF